jgi:Domain of unknown function (DUF5710)
VDQEIAMSRIYLYVPFEETAEVRSLGAHFDEQSKCWYLDGEQDPAPFARWRGEPVEVEYAITSARAFVAATMTPCWKCRARIEVVCLYCEDGQVNGEPYTQFSISRITAVDAALLRQLARWPHFHFGATRSSGYYLANHCASCGVMQGDEFLHCEPKGAFFSIKNAAPGAIELNPLSGVVRMNGDEGFEPD